MTMRHRGGSVTGRWASKKEPELQRIPRAHIQEGLQTWDPFKRPWISGPRPAQDRDRPRIDSSGNLRGNWPDYIILDETSCITPDMWRLMPDAILKDGTMVDWKTAPKAVDRRTHAHKRWWEVDLTEVEKHAMAHMDEQQVKAFEESLERAGRTLESRQRRENFRRGIP